MGIQGMTNWKFSALLAIALMLIAGLFSTTATAEDGAGGMSIGDIGGTAVAEARIEAGGSVDLVFTYVVNDTVADDVDMAGGLVEMRIPAGWKFDNKDAADPPAQILTFGGDPVTNLSALTDDLRKVVFRLGDGWDDGGSATITLTGGIMVPIPDRLTDGNRSDRYEEYEFTTYSRTRSGRLRKLSTHFDSSRAVVAKQPIARVGNIGAGKGTVKITPDKVYETYSEEKPRRFTIEFTAAGPMWDSTVTIEFPSDLDALSAADTTRLLTATGSLTPSGNSGHFSIGNIGASEVSFSAATAVDDDADISATGEEQTVTIQITAMDKGQGFRINYYSSIPSVAAETMATPFEVSTDTDRDTTTTAVTAIPIGRNAANDADITEEVTGMTLVAHGKEGYVTGGRLRQKDGSGTMMIDPMYVQHESTKKIKEFTLIYTAATYIQNAELAIQVPAELVSEVALQAAVLDKVGSKVYQSGTETADARTFGDAGYVWTIDRHANPDPPERAYLTVTANTITWHTLDLNPGQTFRTKIKVDTSGTVDTAGAILETVETAPTTVVSTPAARTDSDTDSIYPFYTSLKTGTANGKLLDQSDGSDADLYAVRGQNIDVDFMVWEPSAADDETIEATELDDHVEYPAASKQSITFRFTAMHTSIKGGQVSFRLPNANWTTPVKPNDKKDNAGRLSAAASTGGKLGTISYGRTVTIPVTMLPETGTIDVKYEDVTIQHNADTVDIIAEFKTSPRARARRAGRVEVEVTNVAGGSGSATITTNTSPAHTIRAGSVDNTITVVYTAAGTMNGGQVALELPSEPPADDEWGNMQDDDAAEPNHVKVTARGGSLDATSPAYVGRDIVVANLEEFEKGDTITFTYSNAEAPSTLGVNSFVVLSAGEADGALTVLAGATKKPADKEEDELLGTLYKDDGGKLRVNIVSAADGTGVATRLIQASSSPMGKYDGSDVETQEVHAGDTSVYILFTYTPGETITDGELRFTVPTGWTVPQEDDQGEAGYTYFDQVRGASIGAPVFTDGSRTVTVEIDEMTKNDAIEIHYGWHGVREGGAEAPDDVRAADQFGFQIKGSEDGTHKSIDKPPTVKVREAASGSGKATIDPDPPDTAAAGSMETITITYTAAGEIENGTLRLEVPEKWSDASSENITVSGGTADHGRQYYETEDDDGDGTKYEALTGKPADVANIRNVLVRNISLDAGGTVVFTYNTMVGPTLGDHKFKLEFKGGEGPGLVATDVTKGFTPVSGNTATAGELVVNVREADAGTGERSVMYDPITAGSTDNEITFVYTADGAIDYPGTFAVRVPTAWGAAPTAASYEVAYQDMDGNALSGTSESVEEVAPSGRDMQAKIKGANSPLITAGHRVVFTYTSAAPDTAGSYEFIVLYDDEQVGDPLEVLVLSADEASMVKVSVTDKLMATGEAIPVTVNLLAADGVTAATRNTALGVTLSSDAPGGMFSTGMDSTATFTSTLVLTFTPGQNEMMAYYKDANAAVATITATPAAASAILEATDDVDTEVVRVDSVSFTVNGETGMYAKTDDTVMITVKATPKRTTPPTVTIGNVASLTTTEKTDMLGTYTVEWIVVDNLHDGMHVVSATLGNLDPVAAPTQLTVDTVGPIVTITAPAAGMTVVNGATVTITATVADGAKSSGISAVTADVSAVDTTQTEAIALSMSNGAYSRSFTISAGNAAMDGSRAIVVDVTDNTGNAGSATVMVTLDNTAPEIASSSVNMMNVKNGAMLEVRAVVTGANTVSANVSALNAGAPTLDLMDADSDGTYTGSVMVTVEDPAADGEVTITITASDDAASSEDTVIVTLDNTMPEITSSSADTPAKNGDTVMLMATVSEASNVLAVVSQLDMTQLTVELTDEDGDLTYTGSVIISMDNTAEDGDKEITLAATDEAGNSGPGAVMVTLDNTVPQVTEVSVGPSPTRNGETVTISAMVSEAATVSANVSDLDTMQTEMVMLTDDDGDGTYTGSHMISEDNEADNGDRTVSVTATDDAGNSSEAVDATVELINTIDYTSMIPADISMFHVPLDVTAIDGAEASLSMVSDLYDALGDAVNYLITTDDGGATWNTYIGRDSGDAAITADRGIVLVMKTEKTITFTGNAWGDGASMINLKQGNNIIGVPVMDTNISTVSDLMDLPEFDGKVTSILAGIPGNNFAHVAADGAADVAVRGDAAYFVSANADASQSVMGDGWSTGETGSAAPIALFGRKVDNQTPTLFVEGAIVDELTGLAKDGFRIKVKNLSTKAALSTVSQGDVAQGYNMTFVDLNASNAARVGDVLEISADSPHPLIGVKPVRHIVTVDDVKNSRIELEDLVAYEIPAETALLNNYPNPFNPETWIPYHLSEDADVKLTIYNVNGEVVRDIDVGHQTAAKYDTRSKAIYWDGRNRFGEQVASGIYFYSLSAGDFSATRKMVILK